MHPRLFNLLVNELQTRRVNLVDLERLLTSASGPPVAPSVAARPGNSTRPDVI